jgi:serine/threonine protein phosphatase PrpC
MNRQAELITHSTMTVMVFGATTTSVCVAVRCQVQALLKALIMIQLLHSASSSACGATRRGALFSSSCRFFDRSSKMCRQSCVGMTRTPFLLALQIPITRTSTCAYTTTSTRSTILARTLAGVEDSSKRFRKNQYDGPKRRHIWFLRGGSNDPDGAIAAADVDTSSSAASNPHHHHHHHHHHDCHENSLPPLLNVYPVSVCSVQGYRNHMEDEFLVAPDLAAVFDGHGGECVSLYIKQSLYAHLQATLPRVVLSSTSLNEQQENPDMTTTTTTSANHSTAKEAEASTSSSPSSSSPSTSSSDETTTIRESVSAAAADNHAEKVSSSGGGHHHGQQHDAAAAAASVEHYVHALRLALDKVDQEVIQISHWSYQGSTAVVAWIHEESTATSTASATPTTAAADAATTASATAAPAEPPPRRTLIVANIGDSRAILSRDQEAVLLTRDQKPNDPIEHARIVAAGGHVTFHSLLSSDYFDDHASVIVDEDEDGQQHLSSSGIPGIFRVNGNLALARAIGDRAERPAISAEPEISTTLLHPRLDEFVVIATDGLWDVMSSSHVVAYIHALLEQNHDDNDSYATRDEIAHLLVEEALRRGSSDNISVVIIWLKDDL